MSFLFCALSAFSRSSRDPAPTLCTLGALVGPHSLGGALVLERGVACNLLRGRRVLGLPCGSCASPLNRSVARPCNVVHELPHRLERLGLVSPAPRPLTPVPRFFVLGLQVPVPAGLPFELPGLLNRSLGIGLPVLLVQGLGSGLAARVPPAELEGATSSSPSSLSPDMSLRCRGRRFEDVPGVELVRPLLLLAPLCIAVTLHIKQRIQSSVVCLASLAAYQ